MREIKFRVWDKVEKKMLDFEILKHNEIGLVHSFQNIGNWVAQQFTGLKDKNGKEIYEGDYVDFDNAIMRVDWCKNTASFIYRLDSWQENHTPSENCVVVGNIYKGK